MLARSVRARLIALIAAGFLLTGMAEAWPQSSPEPPSEPIASEQSADPAAETKKQTDQGESFWQRVTSDPVAFFTLWIAAFTFALAVSTVGLWIVTWRGLIRQRRDTQILQRAYIAVDALGVKPFGERAVAHISVRNAGRLPARKVWWFITHELSGDGQKRDFVIDEAMFYGGNLVLPPDTNMARSHDCVLPPNCVKQFSGGQFGGPRIFLYIWGEIRYTDGFGTSRWTRFCHRYDHRAIQSRVVGQRAETWLAAQDMRYHQYGNDAD